MLLTTLSSGILSTCPTQLSLLLLMRFAAKQEFSPHFMEPESSLWHSQVAVTCPYPEPARSSTCPTSHFMKVHFNIIIPSTPGSSKWSRSLRFPHPNPVCTSPLLHMCYVLYPSHSSRFDHPNNIG